MKKINIKNRPYFNFDQVKIRFSILLNNSIAEIFDKGIRDDHLVYIQDTYKLELTDIKKAIKKCFKITLMHPYILIYINYNNFIINKDNEKISLERIIRFLDFGNLTNIKGSQLFSKILNLVENNFEIFCLLA